MRAKPLHFLHIYADHSLVYRAANEVISELVIKNEMDLLSLNYMIPIFFAGIVVRIR